MDDQLVLGIDAAWPQSLCATYFPYSHHLAESGHALRVWLATGHTRTPEAIGIIAAPATPP